MAYWKAGEETLEIICFILKTFVIIFPNLYNPIKSMIEINGDQIGTNIFVKLTANLY